MKHGMTAGAYINAESNAFFLNFVKRAGGVNTFAHFKGLTTAADRWVVSLKGDVSAGGTDLTWTTQALVGWQFGARRQSGIFVGYRHRAMEYGKTDRFDIEKTLSGFGVAVKIGF